MSGVRRSHKRIAFGSQASSAYLEDQSFVCDRHSDRNFELYCIEYRPVTCMMLFVENHKSHNYVNISDAADEFQDGGVVRWQIVKQSLTESKKEFIFEAEKAEHKICDKTAAEDRSRRCSQNWRQQRKKD